MFFSDSLECFIRRSLSNPFNSGPLSQHFWDDDAAVGLLVVFEEGDHGSRDREGGAVERVDELRPLVVQQFTADTVLVIAQTKRLPESILLA